MEHNGATELQKPHPKMLLTTPLGRFIETRSYRQLFALGVAVLLMSTIYFCNAPNHNGLSNSANSTPVSTFADALYFSIITFTTVGYGDLAPVGWGRLVAALDALSGLAIVALLIGKLASERQYSMLLLLHTSDCQRRISGFAGELHASTIALEQAEQASNGKELSLQLKLAMGLLNAINNYVVFHLNQSRLAEFGNHTSLRFLCAEASSLQRHCATAFRSGLIDDVAGQRCLVLAERLLALVELIAEHHSSDGAAAAKSALVAVIKQMQQENMTLKEWARSHVTRWLIVRVFERLPKESAIMWAAGLHKTIASELNISNKLAQKCIDELISLGWIKIR